jgi:hypothetical protein
MHKKSLTVKFLVQILWVVNQIGNPVPLKQPSKTNLKS